MKKAELPEKISKTGRHRDASRPWYRFVRALIPAIVSSGSSASFRGALSGGRGVWVDLGCGFGEFLADVADVAGEEAAMGLDIDRAALAEARGLGFGVVAADLSRGIPFRDGALDGATLIEVVEHVFDTEALLKDTARVVRPGGWVVLTTPNVAHFTYRVRALTGHAPKQEGYHQRFFTRDRLASLVEASGFEIEAKASYGKQALLTKLLRLGRRVGRGRGERTRPDLSDSKVRYRVSGPFEPLLAQRFVWRLRRR